MGKKTIKVHLSCYKSVDRTARGKLFPYIDLLNYMLKYKIPQVVTLTRHGTSQRKFTL